ARTVVAALAVLTRGSSAELAGPDNERLLQQAATFKVGEEGGDGLIGFAAVKGVVLADVGMSVPVFVVVAAAGVDFDKAHAALDKPAGEQAAAAKVLGHGVVQTVEFFRFHGFLTQIHGLGSIGLHAEGELVAGDAGGPF